MFYLVQEDLYNSRNEVNLIEALDRLGLEYEFYKHVPFTDKLLFSTTRKDVILFGSVRASVLSKNYGFDVGSFYNSNHDYKVYSEKYKGHMLNEPEYFLFGSKISAEKFFCRPTQDTKEFTGKVFYREEWESFIKEKLTNGHKTTLTKDTEILISSPKNILQEIRCFVVGGEVVTASFYKIGSQIIYKECFDEDIIAFANERVKQFSLAPAFVIDICRTDDGLKVIECGCMNCAGFYDINIKKLLSKLEYLYGT